MRLLRKGYVIRNCAEAIAFTEAPESLRGFLKQRFRWSFGIMQSFWKHRDACFNPSYKAFGMIALPNILVYQLLLPILAPLADLILLISLFAAALNVVDAGISHILLYYIVFSLVDLAGAAIAFAFEKEDKRKLLWMIPNAWYTAS
jgi:cellulose synthase/poly-beta-1,6-N-acetylglucosamine synthase-like glycosyltransferase